MKKLLTIFILTLCVLITGCDNDGSSESLLLKVIQSDVTFEAAGGEGFIQIESTGDVTAISNAGWCTIKESTNHKITFKVDENYDYPGRSTQIIIRNESGAQKVTVTQQGAIIIYDEKDLERAVGNEKTSMTLALNASFPFKIGIPEHAKSWLSYEAVDGGIRFNFEANNTNAPRGAEVQIMNGQRNATFRMLQYNANDLLGGWVASFNRYWQGNSISGKGPVTIIEEKEGSYIITLPTSSLFPMTLRASYEDNGFKIASQQYQGETIVSNEETGTETPLYIYAGLASYNYTYWFPEQSVSLAPSMVDGEIVLTLHDNGSASQDTITDLLLGFFLEKDKIAQNTFVSSLTMDIYNLKIYR